MIQELPNHKFDNTYRNIAPGPDSLALCYIGREVLLFLQDDCIRIPRIQEIATDVKNYTFLFSLDETPCFRIEGLTEFDIPGTVRIPVNQLRYLTPKENVFLCAAGAQLDTWYRNRRFCPKCGKPLRHSETERAMVCPECGQTEYPKICPAVIVAVMDGNRLLMSKYAVGSGNFALIAGYAEIGETIEETVHREVFEETGIRVKNLRYYKSQPWVFSDTLLFGFWAELDGSNQIQLRDGELSEAGWYIRDEIPENDGVSLTREMMQVFKNKEI